MLCFCREMKELEVQAREQEKEDLIPWYTRFVSKAEKAGFDRNVGNMLAKKENDGVIPAKLEDHMRNDTICGWDKIFKEY